LPTKASSTAYGHVSVRHPRDPRRYLLARSLSPEMVQQADIMEFELDGTPVAATRGQPYLERFIHGAVYEPGRKSSRWCMRTPRTCCPSASPPRRFAR
jgi:ribulose-5-phosphate 4-epimerase/fuculose-1-phosphate aldolase